MSIRQLSTNAKILLASMAVCFAVTQHALSQETFKCGPYELSPVMNFYLIVEKVPCKVTITVNFKYQDKKDLNISERNTSERLLMRVYDPDENEISWICKEKDDFKNPLTPFVRFFNYITGKKSLNSVSNITEEITLKDKAGIYEFRFCGGDRFNSTVMLESDQKLEYGISWQNGAFRPSAGPPATMYAFIPKGLDSLTLFPGGMTIDRGKGVESVSATNTKIVITEHDAVWKVNFSKSSVMLDMPMIFCTSEEAARRIKNSVEVADDGSWICFAPQKKIPALIKRLWDKKYIGEPESVIAPFAPIKEKLLADPMIGNLAVGSWGGGFILQVPALIREQERLNGKLPGVHMEMLAIAAGVCSGINPYYHKKEIVYRAAVALLYCLYNRVSEDELIANKPGTDKSLGGISWAGYDGSAHTGGWQPAVCFDTFMVADSFGYIGRELKKLDPEAYDVISALMRRVTDRCLPMPLTHLQNKASHYPISIWQFYAATGEKRYKKAALRYEYDIINNMGSAGYDLECNGPDATYEGLHLYNTALFYSWTKDEKTLDYIKTAYTLFNHTVAPEPNNKIIGSSSFSYRTVGGFEHAQYDKGMQMLDGLLPEAAIWMANYYDNRKPYIAAKWKRKYFDLIDIQTIDNPLPGDDILLRNVSPLSYPSCEWHTAPAKVHELVKKSGYTWPALEKNNFIRNFGNEFIAVKRKGYYLCIYVGKRPMFSSGNTKKLRKIQDSMNTNNYKPVEGNPSADFVNHQRLLALRVEQPVEGNPNADFVEFNRLCAIGNILGYSGGNIVLFWSKDYGTSVLGYNVAPTTRHGLIFTDPSGDRWWDDYIKTEFTLDEQKGILHVKGRIENQPVRYERIYDFKEDHLEYTLKLTAESATNAVSLVENFPVAMKYKATKGREKEESVELVKADFNGQSGVKMTSQATGKSVMIVNNKNLEVEILPDYVGGQGSIQFKLPASLEAGKEWSVVFSIVPERLEAVGTGNQ